jgi:hypothetical protein
MDGDGVEEDDWEVDGKRVDHVCNYLYRAVAQERMPCGMLYGKESFLSLL